MKYNCVISNNRLECPSYKKLFSKKVGAYRTQPKGVLPMKSERLKKLENELRDLEKWSDLGLVPKKDLEKHGLEMQAIKAKMEEEKQRLIFLKESGDVEEYALPKRGQQKQLYDHQSIPDVGGCGETEVTESDFDMETQSFEQDHTTLFDIEMAGEEKQTGEHETDEDPYSDKNRWRRSLEISDPESDEW